MKVEENFTRDSVGSKAFLNTTIIIPSFARHFQIRRYLSYLAHFQCKVIVVDGTDAPLFEKSVFLNGLAQINYLHMPGKDNLILRIAEAIELVKTDFFCLMDDSDILLVSRLEEIEKWLYQHPGFFAGGQVYNLATSLGLWELHGWGRWQNSLSLNQDSAFERIYKAVKEERTANLFYAVVPSDIKNNLAENLRRVHINDPYLAQKNIEVILGSLMLIYLKFEKLPVPFWIRTQFLARDYISVYPAFTDEDCIFISKELEILLSEKGDGSEGASALRLHKILQSWKSSDAGVVSKLRMRKKFVVRAWLKRVVLKLLKNCIPSLIERIQIGSRYLAFFELVNGRVFPPELSKNLIHKVHEKDLFFALGLWTYFSE